MGKKIKTFKPFKSHLEDLGGFKAVLKGAAKPTPWSGYAVALAAIESIAKEGEKSAKAKKRKRQAIKYLHKLAIHAGGKKAVRPPIEGGELESSQLPNNSAVVEEHAIATSPKLTLVQSAETSAPNALAEPRSEGADDLKMIAGIGPKLEGLLHGLGIYHFDQIAGWSPADVQWVDEHLRFSGRIVRENWIAQAQALADGGRDEYFRVFGKEPR